MSPIEHVLRRLRYILRVKEGESVTERAIDIMLELESANRRLQYMKEEKRGKQP